MRSEHFLATGLALLGMLAWSRPTSAQTPGGPSETRTTNLEIVEARIIGEENDQLVIDVGTDVGTVPGQLAELWRPVVLRHPVTRASVKDRYRIGSLRLSETLRLVSFALPEGDTRRPPEVGDIVLVRTTPKPSPARKTKRQKTEARETPVVRADPEAEAVATLVASLEGASVPDRISALERWLGANPTNRFAASLRDEVAVLQRLAETRATSPARPDTSSQPRPAALEVIAFSRPRETFSGSPLSLGIEVTGNLRGAVLHARHSSEVAYVSMPMRAAGQRYWTATLPANRVKAPALDYFVELVGETGETFYGAGTEDRPLHVEVVDAPAPEPPLEHRSMVTAYTDYADYNRLRNDDRVWLTEGVFGMRFANIGVRALRTGFGVYRGVGGSVRDLDELGLEPRAVGLTYGHLEGEFGFSRTIGLVVRAAVGLQEDGVGGGGQLHLRIGNDRDTNLLVGGEALGGIGLRGMAALAFDPTGTVPVVLRTEVTNQPAGISGSGVPGANTSDATSDVGGRASVQVGYRVVRPLVVFVRGSYQGRTIEHAGPGFGGGATFEW